VRDCSVGSGVDRMIDLGTWRDARPWPDRPWLIIGKGPTFSRRGDFDLSGFNTFALNHVVRELDVYVAHAIDIEVIRDCADVLSARCEWLLLPRRPKESSRVSPKELEDYFDELPVLRELSDAGRLVSYERTGESRVGNGAAVAGGSFSGSVAMNVLAAMGVKDVRSLGVDGGRTYSDTFGDLRETTLLANRRVSFDVQFDEMEATVARHGMSYSPLVAAGEPIRVFVGADESQLVPAAVLEYTIRKHTAGRVEFTTMRDLPVPMPKDPAKRPRTGFSFYRFMLPKLAGYQGRALYLDCDMQVFANLSELWAIPFDGQTVLCTYQPEPPERWKGNKSFKPGRHLAVMMLDCSRLDWDVHEIVRGLDEDRYGYTELMSDLAIVPEEQIEERIPVEWNSLEHYEAGTTKLVHYTQVPTQPWKNDESPLRELWLGAFREALAASAIDPQVVVQGIEGGHIDPSLRAELSHHPKWTGAAPPVAQRVRAGGASRDGKRSKAGRKKAAKKLARARADLVKEKAKRVKLKRQRDHARKRLKAMESSLTWRGQRAVSTLAGIAVRGLGPRRAVDQLSKLRRTIKEGQARRDGRQGA
jgi:lipopolysaccharide biosynthesis glycosyltransferase